MKELKDLIEGDNVVVHSARGSSRVDRVQKVTPKGFIVVSGHYYNPTNGQERTSDVWNTTSIRVATESDIGWWTTKRLINLHKHNISAWLNQTDDIRTLEKVWEIINGGRKNG